MGSGLALLSTIGLVDVTV
uniref:Uncharacterized protein n=1 Tax=Moniliophthora roreri TaxID=221103 RepID=A0A0W0FG10_MONRR